MADWTTIDDIGIRNTLDVEQRMGRNQGQHSTEDVSEHPRI